MPLTMSTDLLPLPNDDDLLTPAECAALQALTAELRRTFDTVQIFRTRTEMQVSVLNDVKRPTPDAKYWQAVREQDVMCTELLSLSFEYRKNAIEARQLQRQQTTEPDDLAQELLQIEIERRAFVADLMRRTAHHRLREINLWSQIKAELEPQLRYGTTDVDAHQLEAMQLRYQAEASLVTPVTAIADARNTLGLNLSAQRQAQIHALETG